MAAAVRAPHASGRAEGRVVLTVEKRLEGRVGRPERREYTLASRLETSLSSDAHSEAHRDSSLASRRPRYSGRLPALDPPTCVRGSDKGRPRARFATRPGTGSAWT